VEHLYFLALLAEKAGHEAHFLACDGDLPECYTRQLRERPAWRECFGCRLAGIRSYARRNVSSIGTHAESRSVEVPDEWAYSSASTLGRFESDHDYATEEFRGLVARLMPAVRRTYDAAYAWIEKHRLDAVCVFNARMDVTRAIYEAAQAAAVPVVSLERTWFGDGLQLLPQENCLGLRAVSAMVREWTDTPLTGVQAAKAASHIAARFLRTNFKEWRAYNTNARSIAWPSEGTKAKILLVPGSRNEVWGHPDWVSGWPEPTAAYDAIIEHLGLSPDDVVLRCHPNWAQNIGKHTGAYSERYYTSWAHRRGILCIPSTDSASTLGLIEQCDAVVVTNGSAALEAGILGKQVIGTAPSIYQAAGLRDSVCGPEETASLVLHMDLAPDEREAVARRISRQTLRFCYTMVYRVPQYTQYVKADTTTRYRYDFTADPQRFISILKTGLLVADDDTSAADASEEERVLETIRQRRWADLREPPVESHQEFSALRRRMLYRPVDIVSAWKPVGDR